MWIFKNDAFLSIVAHDSEPGNLLVRSRVAGDIERAIPGAATFEDDSADYRYRAVVPREAVAQAIGDALKDLDYPNFKASIREPVRHEAAMRVWGALVQIYGAYGRNP